jgi:hypothetical protein
MENIKEIKKRQKKSQRDFLGQPFAPKVFLFEIENLRNIPTIGKEPGFSSIY